MGMGGMGGMGRMGGMGVFRGLGVLGERRRLGSKQRNRTAYLFIDLRGLEDWKKRGVDVYAYA